MRWLERQRYFLDFILACLWRRKGKNAALMLVYTLVVFLIASVVFFTSAIRREAALVLEDIPDVIVQRVVAGRHDVIPVAYAAQIGSIRGIRSVTPRLWGYYYHPAAGANYTLMVPERFTHGDDAVEAGAGVMRTWGTVQDNRLFFKGADGQPLALKIARVIETDSELVTADLILLSEKTFRRISGVPASYATDLAVRIRNPRECPTIAEKIALALPDTRPILKAEIQRTYDSVFDWRSGYIVVLLSSAVLAFFIFAWDKATGLSAEERAEIGILKAVGWDTADILVIKFWEGLVISLSAFFLGVALAYVHVFLSSAPLFEHALKGWAVLYPEFRLYPVVSAYQLSVLFFLTVVPYSFVTIVPSWRAAATDPDLVMRRV